MRESGRRNIVINKQETDQIVNTRLKEREAVQRAKLEATTAAAAAAVEKKNKIK